MSAMEVTFTVGLIVIALFPVVILSIYRRW
jgi:hypothetical protein